MNEVRNIEWAGYNQTEILGMTCLAVAIAATLLWLLPLRLMLIPFIGILIMVPYEQRIVVLGLDFDMVRLVGVVALLRVVTRGELQTSRVNRLDVAFMWWIGAMVLVPSVMDPGGVPQRLGFALDATSGYILAKLCLQYSDSVELLARWIVLFSVPVALAMFWERWFGSNLFTIFGQDPDLVIRDGEVRSRAAFGHPILAGTFGCIAFSLSAILWHWGQRRLGMLGGVASVVIVLTSGSSGPIYGFLAGALALSLWRVRGYMRAIRLGLWIGLIGLELVMNAHVWALIHRVPQALGFAGGTSYHRYLLIDSAIRNWSDWFLFGTSRSEMAGWGWGMQDVTNHYLAIGVGAGALALILFIWVLVRGFQMIGNVVASSEASEQTRWQCWVIGSLMFVHVVSFLGVSYFSGFYFFLYLTLGLVSGYCGTAWANARAEEEMEDGLEDLGISPTYATRPAAGDL